MMMTPAQNPCRTVMILAYHKVGPPPAGWPTWFYVEEQAFVEHLECLRAAGWQPLDCATLLRGLTQPELLPTHGVLITFDDGYRSNLTVAAPHLVRAGFPAVVFVATDFIGGFNDFDRGTEPCEPMCDWDDLRGLLEHGIAVQSHGMSHTRFSELAPLGIERELRESRAALEQHLNKPVQLMSFPFGDIGRNRSQTRTLLACNGYRVACSYGDDTVNLVPNVDPFSLARFAIGSDTDLVVVLDSAGTDAVQRH